MNRRIGGRIVHLTPEETTRACDLGRRRQECSVRDGRKDAHGLVCTYEEGLQLHMQGACAELAYAKAFGLHWHAGVNTFKAPDVGDRFQVKSTDDPHYDLRVPRDGKESHVFALVICHAWGYELRGEILGIDAKRHEWLHSYVAGRPPQYHVPQSALLVAGFYTAIPPSKVCCVCGHEPLETLPCDWCRRHFCFDDFWTHPHDAEVIE